MQSDSKELTIFSIVLGPNFLGQLNLVQILSSFAINWALSNQLFFGGAGVLRLTCMTCIAHKYMVARILNP